MIITGAASGIGREMASLFVQSGAAAVLFDINKEALEKTARDFADTCNCKVYTREVDVTDYNRFKKAVDDVIAEIGPLDIFINNAGIAVIGELVANTPEDIDSITKVNYLGMVYGSRIILEHFYRQGYGHLVNVASVAGTQGVPRLSLYCGTKAGIINFSHAIRFEAKRKGINVSVLLPSTTDTPMVMDKLDVPEEEMPGMLMAVPLCKTSEVAAAAIRGIEKRKFMIFPKWSDRMSFYMRRYMPFLADPLISTVGFWSFKKKRQKLMEEYDRD